MSTQLSSRLEELVTKYDLSSKEQRSAAVEAFDSQAAMQEDRVSKAPVIEESINVGKLHRDMASLQLDMADYTDEYGKLNVSFGNVVGKKRIYSTSDALKIAFYGALGKRQKVKSIKLDAIESRGNVMQTLVGKMAEILNDQYQRAQEMNEHARGIQTRVLEHMKTLDRRLIDSLKGGVYTGVDLAEAQEEVIRIQKELSDTDLLLSDYEVKIGEAKESKDIETVKKLSEEMGQVLDIKYGILDGRLAADGLVSEIRRDILKSAEGVQSAKGAIAASEANYQAVSILIDSMNALEIKYHNAMHDMIPVFKAQAEIAGTSMEALGLKNALLDAANLSNRLMERNVELVGYLSKEVQELTQTPLYKMDDARKWRNKAADIRQKLIEDGMEWADALNRIHSSNQQPHYVQHQ